MQGWGLANDEEEEGEGKRVAFCTYLGHDTMKGNSEHLAFVLP